MKKLFTRTLALALALTLLMSAMGMTTSAAGFFTKSNHNAPSVIYAGSQFTVKGEIRSIFCNIKNIYLAVYDSGSKLMFDKTVTNINAKTYNLSNIAASVAPKFASLPVKTNYKYVVAVRDVNNNKMDIISAKFTVKAASTMNLNAVSCQSVMTVGNNLSVTGTVSSNYTVTSCYAAVINSAGKTVAEVTKYPGVKSFNMSYMALTTKSLGAGTYTYVLAARDEAGKKEIRRNFTVRTVYDTKVSEFISNPNWKHGASWSGSKTCLISEAKDKCWGCCAYAADFVKYVFNKDSASAGTVFYNPSEIRAGDVIKVKDSQHWFVVLYRNGSKLTTIEGNWGGKVVYSTTAYTVSGNTLCRDGAKFRTFVAGWHYQ